MVSTIDADRWRSAAHRNLIAHLTAPLQAGAVDSSAPITVEQEIATATIAGNWREALVVASLRGDLGAEALRLTATVTTDGVVAVPAGLEFAPFSEAGAALPLANPGDFREMTITLTPDPPPAAADAAGVAAEIAARFEIRIIEGVLGRLLYMLGAEGARLRRQGRELAAIRTLAIARDDALDRLGAELGVPRFFNDPPPGADADLPVFEREEDGDYRQRLAIYRPFLQPARSSLRRRLNGAGDDGEANSGLLAALGVTARFDLVEKDNPFAIAVHLIDEPDGARRNRFIGFVRRSHLILLDAAEDAIHRRRKQPAAQANEGQALRERLNAAFAWPALAAIAPALAGALDRYGRCRAALGAAGPLAIVTAQDAAGGSRFELGLGVAMTMPDAAELELITQVIANRQWQAGDDREVAALLEVDDATAGALSAETAASWLWRRCGLQTHHLLADGTVYLSHLPNFGMTITGPSGIAQDAADEFVALYPAPGSDAGNIVLTAAFDGWDASPFGDTEIRRPSDDGVDLDAFWNPLQALPDAARELLAAHDLPVVEASAGDGVVEHLKRMPRELVSLLVLPAATSDQLLAGDEAAIATIRELMRYLRERGVASALPIGVSEGGAVRAAVVAATIALPQAGANLAARRTTGFRWYTIPISGDGGTANAIGSRTTYTHQNGLTALVLLGYARRGAADPYEYRLELPPDATLTMRQYEYLMNLLAHDAPVGVEINTFSIRQEHVDLTGDGVARPLPPTVARTFRAFQRDRHRGATAVELSGEAIERG